MNSIKTKIRQFFLWIFLEDRKNLESAIQDMWTVKRNLEINNEQLKEYNKKFENMFENIDVSVDHHYHERSWAVISLQGNKSDYIKFVDLGDRDIMEIAQFLSRYDRRKIDASPEVSNLIKIETDSIYPGKKFRHGRR